MSKHFLIIGGMGPQASIHAHKRLIELSQQNISKSRNDSYPRVTHLSINVKDFIADSSKKEVAKKYILECLDEIDTSSIDAGFIACNTAHLLFDDIQKVVDNKLISLIETTRKNVNSKKIGIIATPSTLENQLYGSIVNVLPDDISRQNVERIIRKVILGIPVEELVSPLKTEIYKLRHRGAEKIILGCSELSMFSKYLDLESIIDPIDIAVHELIRG